MVLTDRELFGATRIRRLAPSKRVVTRDLVGKLEPSDLVVHVDHGIARYAGMTQREYGGDVKEYLQLDFAGEDKIFLPADQIGRITRYSGGAGPTLSKLGGTDWERTKRRVRRAVAELAEDLLEIYAARESRRRASASRRTPSGSASSRRRSRTPRRRTSCAPSRR